MIFSQLQRELEKIYSLQNFAPVELFLMTKEELSQANPSSLHKPQVLFQERDGEAFLGVYLGEETKRRLEQNGVEKAPLHDFCLATEEISHFVYLSHCASLEKKVSLLDLEVQAEVDKFLLASRYYASDPRLFPKLFQEVEFRKELDSKEHQRYQEANRLGAKMAKWLQTKIRTRELGASVLGFLRNFYRMESQNKLNKVEKMKGM